MLAVAGLAGTSAFAPGPGLHLRSAPLAANLCVESARPLASRSAVGITMVAEDGQDDRRGMLQGLMAGGLAAVLGASAPAHADLPQGRSVPLGARERGRGPEGVNKPELLPEGDKVNIIDLEKFLSKGQAKKIDAKLAKLEQDTGFKFRVLCQRYPQTPGLAIKDYWGIDDNTIVMIVDRGTSKSGMANILNFNVGSGVDLTLPPVFFTRLRNFFGTAFYVKDNGEDVAIENAIEAIVGCLRNDGFCTDVPQDMKDMRNKKGLF